MKWMVMNVVINGVDFRGFTEKNTFEQNLKESEVASHSEKQEGRKLTTPMEQRTGYAEKGRNGLT